MGYSELIKNFSKIREYMRQFYVYGFRSRSEYRDKSARTYDNEKRRVESYLSEYMSFKRTAAGKNVFISFDTSLSVSNPLYRALKSKSFTDLDITLHFFLLDILTQNKGLTLKEITGLIESDYLCHFDAPVAYDESTVRKKLSEYTALGLVRAEKSGKTVLYSLTEDETDLGAWSEPLYLFSEVSPLGFLGNTMIDKLPENDSRFLFKHHYITHALDSEETLALLDAICGRRYVKIESQNRRSGRTEIKTLLPLKLLISAESGRRYIAGYCAESKNYAFIRIDYILSVRADAEVSSEEFKSTALGLEEIRKHCWGVTLRGKRTEHVEFTVYVGKNERYIINRLNREKRIGTVEKLDGTHYRFKADVYDTNELTPWIRTFIGRITAFDFSNRIIENRIKKDIMKMAENYGILSDFRPDMTREDVGEDDIQ